MRKSPNFQELYPPVRCSISSNVMLLSATALTAETKYHTSIATTAGHNQPLCACLLAATSGNLVSLPAMSSSRAGILYIATIAA